MSNNRIRRVMNESLSHMEFSERMKKNVLDKTKEEKIVKRKISAGLVFALILVLVAGIALAVLSMRDTAQQIVETEQTDGYYQDWPVEKKVSLACALVKLGYAEETEETKRLISGGLSGSEASRIADHALVAFTGQDVSEISFMEIMQAAWGPFTKWTKEEQAWYSQLMVDMGLQGSDHTLYVAPTGPIDEAKAIAIARGEMTRGFELAENALDNYLVTTSFQIPEFAEPGDTQPYWYVEFMAPEDIPEDQRPFGAFWVFIHPDTGALLTPIEEMAASFKAYREEQAARENDPLTQEMRAFGEKHAPNPAQMSLKAKALWSQLFRDRVLDREAEEPGYFGRIELAMAAFVYGMPDEKAITQEEAYAIASAVLVSQFGREEEEIYFFSRRLDVYYDITDPQNPLWKFLFRMPSEWDNDKEYAKKVIEYYGKDSERMPNFKVEINAYTGEVHRAFPIDFADIDSAKAYQEVL